MSKSYPGGISCWHEFVTQDAEAAKTFYAALFGWRIQTWPSEDGAYVMFAVDERPIAGIDAGHHPGGEAPPFWVTYFSCADVDAAEAANTAAGGKTLQPAGDIPQVGRSAVLRDAQGAIWCPFRPLQDPKLPDFSKRVPGDFVWEELLTRDPAAAAEFYAERFGCEVQSMDMGEQGTYRMLARGEAQLVGLMAMPPGAEAQPHWLPYVLQTDIDATAARATELGGRVFLPPMDIPRVGRIAVLADDRGATFAIFKPAQP